MRIKIIQSYSSTYIYIHISHVELYTYKKLLISLWQYMFTYCVCLNENDPHRLIYAHIFECFMPCLRRIREGKCELFRGSVSLGLGFEVLQADTIPISLSLSLCLFVSVSLSPLSPSLPPSFFPFVCLLLAMMVMAAFSEHVSPHKLILL